MNRLKTASIFSLLLLLSACASNGRVFTDFDSDQKFDNYQTFSWSSEAPVAVSGTYSFSGLSKLRITDAVRLELEELGYQFLENKDKADLLVSFTLAARDKIGQKRDAGFQFDHYSLRFGRVYYPYHFQGISTFSRENPYQFTEGSLAIDVYDAKSNLPVFYASISKKLTKKELSGTLSNERETARALLEGLPSHTRIVPE